MKTTLQTFFERTLTRTSVIFDRYGVTQCHHLSHFELQYLPLETLCDAEAQRTFECK